MLTRHERNEIMDFPEIYFLGHPAKKQDRTQFDNRNHNYQVTLGDHLAYRYEVVRAFGHGAFGQVLHCFDHKVQSPVAIKIVVNTAQMHQQGQVEAQILATLNGTDGEHIVRAFDYFIFRSHICITFEILGKNLYELAQQQKFRPFPLSVCRGYARQVLTALDECCKREIIHCDLKPENILVSPTDRERVKLIDFGSGCFFGHQHYEYIQSRFYRAPEVILGLGYDSPMDIWSLALVIVELLIGKPLFSGSTELEQLGLIAQSLGPPPMKMIATSKRRREFFDEFGKIKPAKGRVTKPGSVPLEAVVRPADPNLLDFVRRCLEWDPGARMTAAEGLLHPFVTVKKMTIPVKPSPVPGMLPCLTVGP
jgi:dual specificity tyrosine-phosphorylation-regulated kinase 2/3/4